MTIKELLNATLTSFWKQLKPKLITTGVNGKILTTNDLSDQLKQEYDAAYQHSQTNHAPLDAEPNVLETVSVNGSAIPVLEKKINIAVPTKVSDLANDGGFIDKDVENLTNYYTSSEVDGKITTLNSAIAAAETGKITKQIATVIPEAASAEENVIYLVPNDGGAGNAYDEYMLINGTLELLGSTEVDLTGYVKESDLSVITEDEIAAILAL